MVLSGVVSDTDKINSVSEGKGVGDNRNEDDSDNGVLAVNGKRTHRGLEYSFTKRKNTFS